MFAELDSDGDGTITAEEIAGSIGAHLSPYEVRERWRWRRGGGLVWVGYV